MKFLLFLLICVSKALGRRFAIPTTSLLQRSKNHHKHQFSSAFCISQGIPRGGQSYYNPDDDDDDDRYYSSQRQPNYNNDPDDYYYGRDGGGGGDDYYYDDRGDYPSRRDESSRSGGGFAMPQIIKSGNRKIGLPLLGIGGVLTILGISLFFNKTLMRLGNLFFVAGVPMTIGPGRTAGYFFQPRKARATACLGLGILLVFVGWPIIGIVLEGFGVLNLFGNMFPVAMAILKTMPVIGPLLKGDAGRKNRRDSYDDDRYYDDRSRYEDYNDNDDNQGYY